MLFLGACINGTGTETKMTNLTFRGKKAVRKKNLKYLEKLNKKI